VGHFERTASSFSDPSSASESPAAQLLFSRRHSGFSASARKTPSTNTARIFQTRGFARLDEDLGRHHLTQEINLSNSHVAGYLPLSQATRLAFHENRFQLAPSDAGCPRIRPQSATSVIRFLIQAYFQYRGEPSLLKATNAESNPATTLFNLFSSLTTTACSVIRGKYVWRRLQSSAYQTKYISTGAHVNKVVGITTQSLAGTFSELA